ncbi:hypothetical protein [Bacterioplanoides pacificum]|uniref:Uncharacterized protein n=1 Tax=Bacterioplanoides pacificum TaxID=1171596 RepID=A0ABV7VTP9_9GAMM
MKPLFIAFLLLFPACGWADQPFLGENYAAKLIDQALQQKDLKWLPFPMPYRIDRAANSKEARFLSALADHRLLVREKETRMVTVEVNGAKRRKVQVGWLYNYPGADSSDITDEGFYYGFGRLKNIMEISKPYQIGEYYYVEAYVQWYVDDLQSWVQDAAFDGARTLRRSRESFSKPFERRVYLQYDGHSWAFWDGQPGQL